MATTKKTKTSAKAVKSTKGKVQKLISGAVEKLTQKAPKEKKESPPLVKMTLISMPKEIKEFDSLMDKRILDRRIEGGQLSPETVQEKLKTLPDVSKFGKVIRVEQKR